MSQITTPITAQSGQFRPGDRNSQVQRVAQQATGEGSWQSHCDRRHYPYRSHRLERDYVATGFRVAALVLSVILATFLTSAANASSTRYEISRLASELCVAAEQLSYELKRYNGLGNSSRQASRLSREAGQLVDSITRNRSDSTLRSRFADVARQYRRLEEAYLRASRNIRHGIPNGGFSRVSDLFISLDYALNYNRVYRAPQRQYYAPQPLSNFERLHRDSQRGYGSKPRYRPGISGRGQRNRDSNIYRGNRGRDSFNDRRDRNDAGRGRDRNTAGGGRGPGRPNVAGRGNNRPASRPNQAGRGSNNQSAERLGDGRRGEQRNPAARSEFDHRSPVLERQRNQNREARERSRAERGVGSRRRDR